MTLVKWYPITALIMVIGLSMADDGHGQDSWRNIQMEADEYRFVPNEIILEEGQPVKIEIRNNGNEEHEFRSRFMTGPLIEVEGPGLSVKGTAIHSIIVQSGATGTVKWLSPSAGTYHFECRIPSHHGMDGIITVEAKK